MKSYKTLEESTKWMGLYYKIVSEFFKDLPKYKNLKVLEIGCSWGGFVEQLSINGFNNIKLADIDNIVAEKYKSKLIKLDLLDIPDSQIKELKSDLIFAFDVMEHIDDTELVIKNLKKILNKDGVFLFCTPFPVKKHLLTPTHTNMQYPNYYTNLFKRNGFEVIDFQEVSFIPFTWKLGLPLYVKWTTQNKFQISEIFFAFKKL